MAGLLRLDIRACVLVRNAAYLSAAPRGAGQDQAAHLGGVPLVEQAGGDGVEPASCGAHVVEDEDVPPGRAFRVGDAQQCAELVPCSPFRGAGAPGGLLRWLGLDDGGRVGEVEWPGLQEVFLRGRSEDPLRMPGPCRARLEVGGIRDDEARAGVGGVCFEPAEQEPSEDQ